MTRSSASRSSSSASCVPLAAVELPNEADVSPCAQYERFQMLSEARAIWEDLCKTRQYSYAVWYGHADFETCVPSLPLSLSRASSSS